MNNVEKYCFLFYTTPIKWHVNFNMLLICFIFNKFKLSVILCYKLQIDRYFVGVCMCIQPQQSLAMVTMRRRKRTVEIYIGYFCASTSHLYKQIVLVTLILFRIVLQMSLGHYKKSSIDGLINFHWACESFENQIITLGVCEWAFLISLIVKI